MPSSAADPVAGIACLPIPTPFLVGRVNAYLIDDEPLTLVDTGPNSAKALDVLEQGLAALGRRVEDLELIVITHQHIDHLGLVEILARRSGADVAALDLLAPYARTFSASAEADDEFADRVMHRNGIPSDVVSALRAVSLAYRAWGGAADVNVELTDGGELVLRDRTFRVLHRPGHSPSDTVLVDEERRTMLAGDHLLRHISSNPLVTRPLAGTDDGRERPRALMAYLDSLRATRELELDLVLPGHGESITDHRALIDERLELHARRARKIHRMLGRRGPSTAYDLAKEMWGKVAVSQAYLTLSEVLGHADLLVDEGKAEAVDDGEVVRWRAL